MRDVLASWVATIFSPGHLGQEVRWGSLGPGVLSKLSPVSEHLEQGSAGSLWARFDLPPVFVNTVSWGHSHPDSFTWDLWLLASYGMSLDGWPLQTKILTIWPFTDEACPLTGLNQLFLVFTCLRIPWKVCLCTTHWCF